MRVLIVHAFGKRDNGRATLEYISIIKSAFANQSIPSKIEYIVRTKNNLNDFLYERHEENSNNDSRNLTMFDRLDFIFIGGSTKLLPWRDNVKQVFYLLSMCYRSGKNVYCSGFGLFMLQYIIATDGASLQILNDNQFKLPNNNNNIKFAQDNDNNNNIDINEFDDIKDKSINSIGGNKKTVEKGVYLHEATGDIYVYSKLNKTYETIMNIGMNRSTIGVRKTKFTPTISASNENSFSSVLPISSQILCSKKKNKFSHWLYEDIESNTFCLVADTHWIIHEGIGSEEKSRVTTLAESVYGPEIIEYGHMVGIHSNPGIFNI
jgi:hypothetical protein